MKTSYLLLSLIFVVSCGAAPEHGFQVDAASSDISNDILIGNSEDSTINTGSTSEESTPLNDDVLLEDDLTTDESSNDEDVLQDTESDEGPISNPLLASRLHDIDGNLVPVNDLFSDSEFAILGLFEQNCILCERMAFTLENNQRTQQLVSSDRCELSLVFDDFGNENNVLESISQNLPNFIAERSYVRSNDFMNIEHFGPLFIAVNSQGEIVKSMRTLIGVENFCR